MMRSTQLLVVILLNAKDLLVELCLSNPSELRVVMSCSITSACC